MMRLNVASTTSGRNHVSIVYDFVPEGSNTAGLMSRYAVEPSKYAARRQATRSSTGPPAWGSQIFSNTSVPLRVAGNLVPYGLESNAVVEPSGSLMSQN